MSPKTPASDRATGSGGSDEQPPAGQSVDTGGGGNGKPAVGPGNVTVAVLNGTLVPGSPQHRRRGRAHGFELGTIANISDQEQQRAESVVLYAPGHEARRAP